VDGCQQRQKCEDEATIRSLFFLSASGISVTMTGNFLNKQNTAFSLIENISQQAEKERWCGGLLFAERLAAQPIILHYKMLMQK